MCKGLSGRMQKDYGCLVFFFVGSSQSVDLTACIFMITCMSSSEYLASLRHLTSNIAGRQERPEFAAMLEAFPQVPPHPNALPILHWETHMVRPLCAPSVPHGIHSL